MKKYICLFFAIKSLSVSCMEQQRPRLFSVNYEDAATKAPLRILDVNGSINQTYVITRPITPVLLEANQGDWQKLNHIANLTYNSPTYQVVSLRHAISQQKLQQEQEEKKTLLKTNVATQRDISALKERIYGCVDDMLDHTSEGGYSHEWRHLNNIFSYSTLCEVYRSKAGYQLGLLINMMRAAKEEHGITEDMMGSYTYHKDSSAIFKELYHRKAFIFSLLKKYIHMISIIPEQLPFSENTEIIVPIDFSQITYKQDNSNLMYTKYSVIYPAFSDLAHNIYYAFETQGSAVINSVASCFYAFDHKNQKSNEYRILNNYNFIGLNYFYKKAYDAISFYASHEQVYDLLQLIEGSRESTIESYEDKLAQQMVAFYPSATDFILNPSYWGGDCFTDTVKQYICQLLTLIKQYNKARQYRITPTPEQYKAYNIIQKLDIPLPDAWNSNMFDPEQYAFIEFFYLMGAINQLKRSKNFSHNGP